MRKALLVALSVFGLVGFASGLRAELRVDALAEEEALSVFFERNLDLIASQYQIDKAEAQEWIAGAIPNPFFSVGMNELTGDFTLRPDLNAQGIGLNVILTQILETNGKRGLLQESSQIGREALEMDFKDTIRILAAEVRRKFSLGLVGGIGTEFMPKLDEGNIWLTVTLPTPISLTKAKEIEQGFREGIETFTEAESVLTQLGRPEDGTDPKGFNNLEVLISLAPKETWHFESKEALIQAMNERLSVFPGVQLNFS